MQEQYLSFGPYRLQLANEQLWRGKRAIRLTPKAFAVLRYLSEHPGQLATKDTLFEAVWSETVVSDVTLAACVREVRKALGDDAKTPRFIETVHRRGYRFIAPVHESEANEPPAHADPVPESQTLSSHVGAHGGKLLAPEGLPEHRPYIIPQPSEETRGRPLWLLSVWSVAIVVLIGAGVTTIRGVFFPHETTQEEPALPLPDKPSIAVLPLMNMSGDPEQEYFSNGMTEAIITDLSKFSGLLVIARQSTFAYKGQAVDIKTVGRELGVRYVLEGSVQRSADQVRIMVRLIDAKTGLHVWAESYNEELQDIFAVQDAITEQVRAALRVEVQEAEFARVRQVPTQSLTAYDAGLRGLEYFRRMTKENNAQARQLAEQAIALDPAYAGAYVLLGFTYTNELIFQWNQDPQNLERAFEQARQALALDDTLSNAHHLMGWIHIWRDHDHERAIAEVERAIALDPNNDRAYATLADLLSWVGRPEQGRERIEHAMRLNPHYPVLYLHVLSNMYSQMGQYEEAIEAEQRLLSRQPDFLYAYLHLVFAYSQLGQDEEARKAAAEALRLNPHFSLEKFRQAWPMKDQAHVERVIAALRKAGLE